MQELLVIFEACLELNTLRCKVKSLRHKVKISRRLVPSIGGSRNVQLLQL